MSEAPDGVSLENLVQTHADRLFRYAYRLVGRQADAEDLVQEAFLDAHRSLHQLRDPAKALPWLLRILLSRRAKWIRSQKLQRTVSLPTNGVEDRPQGVTSTDFDSQALFAALDRVPDEFREVLVLFYFRELKYREIAEVTGSPIGTVMSRIARGKSILRQLLEREFERTQHTEVRDGS